MKTVLLRAAAVALLMTTSFHCFADDQMLDIDTKWRAKIAKEKVKQGARDRADNARGDDADKGQCGSQSIGNVNNTSGRPGSGPREVFVFAPNAINIVGAGGCR